MSLCFLVSTAIRQAIAKGIVAFYQKYVNESEKKEVKDILLSYDRTLLVADPRRREPKKFGGRSARARFQKSYRNSNRRTLQSAGKGGAKARGSHANDSLTRLSVGFLFLFFLSVPRLNVRSAMSIAVCCVITWYAACCAL